MSAFHFHHRFAIDGRALVATISEVNGRLFVDRIAQVVKRPRAYGEVQRKIWPKEKPNAIARAALENLGADGRGSIEDEKAAALARCKGGAA